MSADGFWDESQYLTEDERDALHDWWDEESTVSVESSFPVIARIVGTRVVHAWNVGYRRGLADADLQHGAENPFAVKNGSRANKGGCTPYCDGPCSAACKERLGTRLYLDILETTNPSPEVQAVIDEIRADMDTPPGVNNGE